jgi:type II secretory pathway component GspD/PulD (secretin)
LVVGLPAVTRIPAQQDQAAPKASEAPAAEAKTAIAASEAPAAEAKTAPAASEAPAAEAKAAPAASEQAPPAAEAPAPTPGEPLYSLEANRQDSEDVIMGFAKQAGLNVALLDRGATLVSVRFSNLPLDKAFRTILRAADLDYVKNEDGYTVGLPTDLALRFPNPDDKIIVGTYRCRRIAANSLVKAIQAIIQDQDFKASTGPQFLTPLVEQAGDTGTKVLGATDETFHTHDVVFAGPPALVRRALSLCRKFDRPRKQVRVSVRVVQMTTTAAKNLGVAWMPSVNLVATEQPNATATSTLNSSGSVPQGSGLTLGKFSHNIVSLNATLNAMEQTGNSKTLANPTLLVLDGEKSFILSGTKYVFPKISSKDPSGQSVYDTVEVKLGLYLQVGVQVGLDDDMVLTIYPQVQTLTGTTVINAIPYPIISSIEEQATVRALKGDVIVLGGLRKDITTDNKVGIPFLASLPLFGKLFSSDSTTKNTEELMFFLTPEIIDDPDLPLDMKLTVSPGPSQPVS